MNVGGTEEEMFYFADQVLSGKPKPGLNVEIPETEVSVNEDLSEVSENSPEDPAEEFSEEDVKSPYRWKPHYESPTRTSTNKKSLPKNYYIGDSDDKKHWVPSAKLESPLKKLVNRPVLNSEEKKYSPLRSRSKFERARDKSKASRLEQRSPSRTKYCAVCKNASGSAHKCGGERDLRSEHLAKLSNRWASRTPTKLKRSPQNLNNSQSKINSWDVRRYTTESNYDSNYSSSNYKSHQPESNSSYDYIQPRGLNSRGMNRKITFDANEPSENFDDEYSELETPQLRGNVVEPNSPSNLFKAKQESQQLSQNPNYIQYNYDMGHDPFQKIFKGQSTLNAMQEDGHGKFTKMNTFEQFSPMRKGFKGPEQEKGLIPNLGMVAVQKSPGSTGKWGSRDPNDWMRNSVSKEDHQSMVEEKTGGTLLKDFKRNLVPCPHCGRRFQVDASKRHIEVCARSEYKPAKIKYRRL